VSTKEQKEQGQIQKMLDPVLETRYIFVYGASGKDFYRPQY